MSKDIVELEKLILELRREIAELRRELAERPAPVPYVYPTYPIYPSWPIITWYGNTSAAVEVTNGN